MWLLAPQHPSSPGSLQPEPPPEQSTPHLPLLLQAETPMSQAVASLDSAERAPSQPDEEARLRASLAQREAALLRKEGENYLLGSQVHQLEQRVEEVGRDAQFCVAQLAQALQLLESANTRAPLKAEVWTHRLWPTLHGPLQHWSVGCGRWWRPLLSCRCALLALGQLVSFQALHGLLLDWAVSTCSFFKQPQTSQHPSFAK